MLRNLWELFKNKHLIKKLRIIFVDKEYHVSCKIDEINYEGYFSNNNYVVLNTGDKRFTLFDDEIFDITVNSDYVVIQG